jgi:hypothetical protein
MFFTNETIETTTYQFRNKASSDKTILLEHPLNPSRRLRDATPSETTASSYRFEIKLGPDQELTFPLDEVISQQSSLRIERFSEDSLSLTLDGKIPDELLQRLRQVISMRSDLSDILERRDASENEVTAIFKDQERLRENLKALDKSDKGLRESYLSKMAEQEAKLRQLRNTMKALDERVKELEQELKSQISELAWEGDLDT